MLPHAVLRAAAWPIELVDAFAAQSLASCADAVHAAERAVVERRADVEAVLHACIPRVGDRATRAYLLAVRRHVHGTTEPLPSAGALVLDRLAEYPNVAALVASEQAVRCALGEQRASFERLHAAALEEQQAALRRLTAEPRFQRALLVANLPVARAWLSSDTRRAKRQRHLETAVFHYAMRACGRTTPNSAWAGVAPVRPSTPPPASLRSLPYDEVSEDRGGCASPADRPLCEEGFAAETQLLIVRPGRARYAVAVSLQPFVLMAGALTRLARYRWGRGLHLNPTVRAEASGGWRYERDDGGVHRWVNLPHQALLSALIEAYADGQAHAAGPLVDALAGLAPEDASIRETLERLVNWLIDRDVLRCDLRLPASAPDAWAALAELTTHLDPADRSIWEQTIDRLRRRCDRLAREFDDLSPLQLTECLTAIEADLQQLWTSTGHAGAPPGPLVHLDMRLGFEVTWTPAAIEKAAQTVEALLDFHAGDGGAEIFRHQSVRDVVASLGEAADTSAPVSTVLDRLGWQVPPRPRSDAGGEAEFVDTLEFVLGQMPPESRLGREAREYCRAWERLLEPVHTHPVFTLAPPQPHAQVLPGPGGAVLLRLAADDDLWLGPARPEAGLFAARFATLLEAPILDSLREGIAAAHQAGVTPVEVVGWDGSNFNGALHPALTRRTLDPHELSDGCLSADRVGQRLWVRERATDRLLAPVYSTGADIGYHDVCSRLLLVVAASHGWEFPSFQTPPLRAERTRWRHLPRLVLSGGQVLRPERWTIDRAALERINTAKGAERYLAWRGELRRTGPVPDLVHVRCGPHAPELLLRTDSPLAVRCLFDTHAARAPWMELAELPGTPGRWPVQDRDGNHYLAELAVSWFAAGYWDAVVPDARLTVGQKSS